MDEHTAQAMQALAGQARDVRLSDGVILRVVPESAITALAVDLGRSLRRTELAALEAGFVPARYQRNMSAYSVIEQAGFLRTRAMVVGLGGLGGNLLEILARAGLGRITVCDPDAFVESNLNRQLLCTGARLGKPKATAASDRAYEINPAVEVEVVRGAFTCDRDGNALLEDHDAALRSAHILVDCLGGLDNRKDLVLASRRAGIPLVTAAMAGHAGWVGTVLPGRIGPVEAMGLDTGDPDGQEWFLGTPAPAVTVAAALQAEEVLALAAGREPALAGKVLLFDLERMDFETVSLA